MPNIRKIPATIDITTSFGQQTVNKRRTAAYARVSTDKDEQFSSYEAQIDYYTQYIKARSELEFVKVYTDEGITGTSTKKREGFRQMVSDALNGKIDLIITKSVSRFARNTIDSLTTIRQLKEHNVEIFFEKENIWTFDGKGELLITIMSSLAQEESRSISENCTWGQRKRFADGKGSVAYSYFLGYDKGENGTMVINKEEAEVVKRIFYMFLNGAAPSHIAKTLTEDGIISTGTRTRWHATRIYSILRNEKYKGDALLQKTYTTDFLTKKQKKNEGELPQYYVENDHEAIIPPSVFEEVQLELKRRKAQGHQHNRGNIFAGKIICGQCGAFFGKKIWHSNSKYKVIMWQCNKKYEDKTLTHESCNFREDELKELYLKAVNQLLKKRNEVITAYDDIKATVFDTSALEEKLSDAECIAKDTADLINAHVSKNCEVLQDQTEYNKKYYELAAKYDKLKNRCKSLREEIADKKRRQVKVENFISTLSDSGDRVTVFTTELWSFLLDHVIAYGKTDVHFLFKDGTDIKVSQ